VSQDQKTITERLAELGGVKKAPKTLDTTPPPKRYARDGKAGWNTYHDPAVIAQIKLVCIEQNMSQQDFARQAINMMFARYGKGQIA
jgi:hypothetical protein